MVLLDELEKAHPDVFNILLQVLEDGRLTDGQGRTVDFTNTVLIMTSNIPGEPIEYFKPEFVNRIDEIVRFHALTEADLARIVSIQLGGLRGRLAERRLSLAVTPAAEALAGPGRLRPRLRGPPAAPGHPAPGRGPAGPGPARGSLPRGLDGDGGREGRGHRPGLIRAVPGRRPARCRPAAVDADRSPGRSCGPCRARAERRQPVRSRPGHPDRVRRAWPRRQCASPVTVRITLQELASRFVLAVLFVIVLGLVSSRLVGINVGRWRSMATALVGHADRGWSGAEAVVRGPQRRPGDLRPDRPLRRARHHGAADHPRGGRPQSRRPTAGGGASASGSTRCAGSAAPWPRLGRSLEVLSGGPP